MNYFLYPPQVPQRAQDQVGPDEDVQRLRRAVAYAVLGVLEVREAVRPRERPPGDRVMDTNTSRAHDYAAEEILSYVHTYLVRGGGNDVEVDGTPSPPLQTRDNRDSHGWRGRRRMR